MSALKDSLKGIASQVQLSSPLGFYLQKLAAAIVTIVEQISAALAQRFAERVELATAVIVPAGTFADIYTGNPNALTFSTDVAGEKVQVTFTGSRLNTAPTGTGTYQIVVDGAPLGIGIEVAGDVESSIALSDILTIDTIGTHTLNIRLTAATGNETIGGGSILTAVDYGAI